MKKIIFACMMMLFATAISAYATMKGVESSVQFSSRPMNLPDNSFVEVLQKDEKEATVGIRGVQLLRVEIYKRNSLAYADLQQQGEWTTFTLKSGERFNFIFLSPNDGKNHFALVLEDDISNPPAWMGSGITATKDNGQGSSMTVRK